MRVNWPARHRSSVLLNASGAYHALLNQVVAPRGFLACVLFPLPVSVLTIDSPDAPVSIAVELATLRIKAFRYFLGFLRLGLVSMRGLCVFISGRLDLHYNR
jgi:hypothetical protein